MLTVFDEECRFGRRDLLRIGSWGMAGMTLPSLIAMPASAANRPNPITGRSVIFLFQQGGPSQLETFDPKIDRPQSNRTMTGVTKTSIPGVIFGDTMGALAKVADKLTIVRSYQTGNAGHNIQPIVGPDSLETNIGAHYARVAGTTRAKTGMPTNAVIYPASVDAKVPRPEARGDLRAAGNYGAGYSAFVPGAGGQLQKDMQLRLPADRFGDRRKLLKELDRLRRYVDSSGDLSAADEIRQQAYRLMLGGGVATALDLSKEDPKTLARYDTSRFARIGQWDKVNRGKRGYYFAQARTIGKLLLLGRRLCEAGCGFVTVHAGYAGVWDMHADGNNLNMVDGMEAVGRSFDHAVAAFVEDVESRGLSEKIMLVASGEMGRSPRVNERGGRDHWARLAPLLLYGGGIGGGKVIGKSTRNGGEPASDPLTPKHLISTILNTVFDVGQLRLVSGVPLKLLQLAQADPIPGI